MTTSICIRTASAAAAAADLEYLHSVKSGTVKAWVAGYTTSDDELGPF
jgi:hypothetical protein